MNQTETAESAWNDIFDLLDKRGKGYLTADDIVHLSRDVQNSGNDHGDDDAVVSAKMAERMLAHLIQPTRVPAAMPITFSSSNAAPQPQTGTTVPTMSRAEFGQFMSPLPLSSSSLPSSRAYR
jgi:hypothetical protein